METKLKTITDKKLKSLPSANHLNNFVIQTILDHPKSERMNNGKFNAQINERIISLDLEQTTLY